MFQVLKRLYRRLFYVDYVVIGNIPHDLHPPVPRALDGYFRGRDVPQDIKDSLEAAGVTGMMDWSPPIDKSEPPAVAITGWLLTGEASQAAWDAETSKSENDKV